MGVSHAASEAAERAVRDAWIAEQLSQAPPLSDRQRAALAPLLDCTGPSLTLRRTVGEPHIHYAVHAESPGEDPPSARPSQGAAGGTPS